MLIVYSEVLSKAPRFLQTHFMYNARQYWGFKAPYSEDWEVVEKLAFVFSLSLLWEIIALYNAGCDIPENGFFQQHLFQKFAASVENHEVRKECIGYAEHSEELRKISKLVITRTWAEFETYPEKIIWFNREQFIKEAVSQHPVRLIVLKPTDLALRHIYSSPEEIVFSAGTADYGVFKQGDSWILPHDLDGYLLSSDQIHSGYDSQVKEFTVDPFFAKNILR